MNDESEARHVKTGAPIQRSALRVPRSNESGQVIVWTIILLPLLLALVGLVFDSGLLFVQHRRARWAADGAAVAAASEIDVTLFANTGQVKINAGQAAATAQHFAQLNNPNLRISRVYVQANTVVVQGTVSVRPVFLGLFGVGELRLDVTGKERPAWGIAREGE
jgi:uncharacterized membrane protein